MNALSFPVNPAFYMKGQKIKAPAKYMEQSVVELCRD